MPISLKANSDGSAEILNGVQTAITISPNGNVKASGMQGYNYIINGNFDIWQRGTSQTSSGYGSADRWRCTNFGSTKTASRQAFTLGQPEVPDNPEYYIRHVVNSVAGADNFCVMNQRIEYVKTLAGKKATLSFWAKADAPKNIAIDFDQDFGTGGTPSSVVNGIGSQLVALTTSWKKYTITIDIPSIAGKILGTDRNDCLICRFWFDAGSTFATRSANLGQQSGTFDIANVSIVEGDIDVKPIPRSVGEELELCQRYYEPFVLDVDVFIKIGYLYRNAYSFNVTKRANPVFTSSPPVTTNFSSLMVYATPTGFRLAIGPATEGPCRWLATIFADAEL